ncbi:DUF1214 domain-containing protein [Rhizobium sp. PAMB 3174]
MFRIPFLVAVGLLVAFGVGILSSIYALKATEGFGAIRLGAWTAFPRAQTADADPYAKAHRANAGRLTYGEAEALRFVADRDDSGEAFSTACTYRISGQTPQTRLWTLYVAGADGRPFTVAKTLPMALNSWVVVRGTDGMFDIVAATDAKPGNWLALLPTGTFRLVLTLFDTPTAGSAGLMDLTMPQVQRLGCKNA